MRLQRLRDLMAHLGLLARTEIGYPLAADGIVRFGGSLIQVAVDTANPTKTSLPNPGDYFDVHLVGSLSASGAFAISDCTAGAATLAWYNPAGSGAWQTVSGVTTSHGCLQTTITSSTTPSLTNLSGAIFADDTGSPVSLAPGWNLVEVPIQPSSPITTSDDLIANLTANHTGSTPAIGAVATYTAGWFTLAVPGYTSPLPLQAGQGIFVLSAASSVWVPPGNVYTSPTSSTPEPTLSLQPGWNLMGAPYPLGGLDGTAIDSQLGSQCGMQEVALYDPATGYRTFIHGSTTSFHAPITSGMWIECTQAYTWTPS